MFAERIFSNEVIELGIAMKSTEGTDVIKRNNVSPENDGLIRNNVSPTDLMIKFNRLKRAMRLRSNNVY